MHTDSKDFQRKWFASSRWAEAAQFALSASLSSSQSDLQQLENNAENSILQKTKDAVVTLQDVLEGKHDEAIENTLNEYQVPRDRWWSAFYKVIEGITLIFMTYIISLLMVTIGM